MVRMVKDRDRWKEETGLIVGAKHILTHMYTESHAHTHTHA